MNKINENEMYNIEKVTFTLEFDEDVWKEINITSLDMELLIKGNEDGEVNFLSTTIESEKLSDDSQRIKLSFMYPDKFFLSEKVPYEYIKNAIFDIRIYAEDKRKNRTIYPNRIEDIMLYCETDNGEPLVYRATDAQTDTANQRLWFCCYDSDETDDSNEGIKVVTNEIYQFD